MDDIVLDASVLSAFFLDEEAGEKVQRLIEGNARFYAPHFWRFEASNAVWKRKAVPYEIAEGIVEKIWSFTVYGEGSVSWVKEAFLISRKSNVTFYDSSYIAFAKMYGLPLWTLDRVQARAAEQAGVILLKTED